MLKELVASEAAGKVQQVSGLAGPDRAGASGRRAAVYEVVSHALQVRYGHPMKAPSSSLHTRARPPWPALGLVGLGVLGGLVLGALIARAGLAPPVLVLPVPSYAAAVDQIAPSVVDIAVDAGEERVGAGFAISAGEIVTARHLVVGASRIDVRDAYGAMRRGRLVGDDARLDLALIEVDGAALPPAGLGRSITLRVGDPVLALGNPYGLGQSLSVGVVAGLRRRLSDGDLPDANFLQLAVPLNPGNSGGPIVDGRGRVVGILTGTHTRGQAIAFAIPIEGLLGVLDDLRAGKRISRAWLGVRVEPVGEAVVVTSVMPTGPAAEALIRPGDRLTSLDGLRLNTPADLTAALDRSVGGQVVSLRLLRDGQLQLADVHLADWAAQPVVTSGLTLRPSPGAGGVVVAVRPGSRAESAGVEVGDIVRLVNGLPVRAPADVKSALQGGGADKLDVIRAGQGAVLTLSPLGG